jgi:hypothetical protein
MVVGAIGVIFLGLMVGIPWGIQRHNWLGIRDVIRMD